MKIFCPILYSSSTACEKECLKEKCMWWLDYYDDCSIPLLGTVITNDYICKTKKQNDYNKRTKTISGSIRYS